MIKHYLLLSLCCLTLFYTQSCQNMTNSTKSSSTTSHTSIEKVNYKSSETNHTTMDTIIKEKKDDTKNTAFQAFISEYEDFNLPFSCEQISPTYPIPEDQVIAYINDDAKDWTEEDWLENEYTIVGKRQLERGAYLLLILQQDTGLTAVNLYSYTAEGKVTHTTNICREAIDESTQKGIINEDLSIIINRTGDAELQLQIKEDGKIEIKQ